MRAWRHLCIRLCGALLLCTAALPALAARLALVLGNDAYQFVPPLKNASEDARAVGRVLSRNGFDVTLVLDTKERELKAVLRGFKAKVNGGDDVVVFFAGHGVQIANANYLLPVDIRAETDEQVRDEAIPLQRILDDLDERRARFSLAIVDACRDNPFKRAGRAIGGRGLAPTSPATGQMVMYSAGSGQQALDRLGNADRDPNGVFVRVLLKEIEKGDVAADRLLRNVRAEVARLARGANHEQIPALYDQALGEFYIKPPSATAKETVAAPAATVAAAVPNRESRPAPGGPVVPLAPAGRPPPAAEETRAAAPGKAYAFEDKDWGVTPTTTPKRAPFHAPTPTTIPGGRVIRALELAELLKSTANVVVVDVLDSPTRKTIPGAIWVPAGGSAVFYGSDKAKFESTLAGVTQNDKSRPLVFLCVNSSCWLSYNASLLAMELGYKQVLWFRGGTEAWNGASLQVKEPTEVIR